MGMLSVSLFTETLSKRIRNKGKSTSQLPTDYIVIDTETTGLSPEYDDIIEVSALKILNHKVVDRFSTLVKPESFYIDDDDKEYYVDKFITDLTGITNDMLEDAPVFEDIVEQFLSFIEDSVLVGHNIHFDLNFLYDKIIDITGVELRNDYCDLLRISRQAFPDFINHKLDTLASKFGIEQTIKHRGLADCETTYACFEYCKNYIIENNISINPKSYTDLRTLQTTNNNFDETHPLFGKYCVFTGTLERMVRKDAAQLVVDLGGLCENNVTKKTNYLILGNNDYCTSIKDGKSGKQKKAESLILKGQDLNIIPEDVFYDMISEHSRDE